MAACQYRWEIDCTVARYLRIRQFSCLTNTGEETCLKDLNFFSAVTHVEVNPKLEVVFLKGFNHKFELVSVQLDASLASELFPDITAAPIVPQECPCDSSPYTPSQDYFNLLEGIQGCIDACCTGLTVGFEVVCS